jgi:ectoine hydroxylase-related dioxygenase (phytanoyl-CoA dioxygenase family)
MNAADPYLAASTADSAKPRDGLDRDDLPHLTAQQRADFERAGFLVLPGVLDAAEIARWTAVVERLDRIERTAKRAGPLGFVEVRNAIAKDHELKDLITHPLVFPLVADLMGPDIQIITTHSMVRGTARPGTAADFKASGWHKDGGAQIPAVNGMCPWLYTKVGFFLTDLSEPGRGNLRVVPGSHRSAAFPGKTDPAQIDPDGTIEVLTRPGDVVIFQQSLWHSVGPNVSPIARKNIYLGYSQRWLRPIDYVEQSRGLLDTCTPIQRQLLGDHASECTFYLPLADDVPLRDWLAAYQRGA